MNWTKTGPWNLIIESNQVILKKLNKSGLHSNHNFLCILNVKTRTSPWTSLLQTTNISIVYVNIGANLTNDRLTSCPLRVRIQLFRSALCPSTSFQPKIATSHSTTWQNLIADLHQYAKGGLRRRFWYIRNYSQCKWGKALLHPSQQT